MASYWEEQRRPRWTLQAPARRAVGTTTDCQMGTFFCSWIPKVEQPTSLVTTKEVPVLGQEGSWHETIYHNCGEGLLFSWNKVVWGTR